MQTEKQNSPKLSVSYKVIFTITVLHQVILSTMITLLHQTYLKIQLDFNRIFVLLQVKMKNYHHRIFQEIIRFRIQ